MSANTIPDPGAILSERQRCADVALEYAEAANSLAEAATSRQRKMASSAQFYIANNISHAILNPPSAASSRAEQTGEAQSLPASPVANNGWQPIESAPLDDLLLLACADWGHSTVLGKPVPVKVGGWWDGRWNVFGASWTPTHWQCLPAGPVANLTHEEAQ